jgi:hypothetical protein
MIHGVDVSSYQEDEFPLTTPGGQPVDFVIIKATQGLGYLNPELQGQLDWARKNGLSVGFYHFADAGDIEKQADFFLATVRPRLRSGDHLWFDWEKRDISSEQKDQWIRYVKTKEPAHRVGLYCNRDFWLNLDVSSFAGDGLWIADWTGAGNPPRIEAAWRIHQHTTTRGIDENVADFESRAAMKAWAGEPVTGGGNAEVMAALDVIATAILRIGEKVDQLGRQVAAIPADETTTALRELKTAVGRVQSTATGLPRKTADEINKRMAE